MQRRKKGAFTLVELIVVIAIIAILTTVAIVGYNVFIEQANLSADNQTLASMNRILQTHTAVNFEDLDADDVKYIIDTANGEKFNYTPKSKGYGFFYLANQKKIVLEKYDEMAKKYPLTINEEDPDAVINYYLSLSMPEQYYDEDVYLLTEEGHKVANLVTALRELANTASNDELESKFTEILNNKNYQNVKDQYFIYAFGPAYNYYVSEDNWKASLTNQQRRIIFARGITHIPTSQGIPLSLLNINAKLPRTVKSIEDYAFYTFGDSLNLQIDNSIKNSLYVDENAFTATQSARYGLKLNPIPLLDIVFEGNAQYNSETNELTVVNNNLEINIDNLPKDLINQLYIKTYKDENGDDYLLIRVYGEDSVLGQLKVKIKFSINN